MLIMLTVAAIPVLYMQIYVLASFLVLLIALAYDFVVDKKLEFTRQQRKAVRPADKKPSPSMAGAVARALIFDVASSYPLGKCSKSRRVSHVITIWGFILSIIALLISLTDKIFVLSLSNPSIALQLAGNIMLLVGVLWYLPQRVNVQYEGNSLFRLTYADAFVVNLIFMSVLGILASIVQYAELALVLEALYLTTITLLFALTHWSKFPHAFYKGALFVLDRMDRAKGISYLPTPLKENIKEG
ncbi:MAG: hypothetical protein QXQ39_05645 [Conexivisphaerales archaeon]